MTLFNYTSYKVGQSDGDPGENRHSICRLSGLLQVMPNGLETCNGATNNLLAVSDGPHLNNRLPRLCDAPCLRSGTSRWNGGLPSPSY